MIVWHGSPHKFDAFDSSRIGTGEGQAAFGPGTYLTETNDIGVNYANELTKRKLPANIARQEAAGVAKQLKTFRVNDEFAVAKGLELKKPFDAVKNDILAQRYGGAAKNVGAQELASIEAARKPYEDALAKAWATANPKPYVYKVDLPDEQVPKLLDWDRPFSEQTPEVQKMLLDAYNTKSTRYRDFEDFVMVNGKDAPGRALFNQLSSDKMGSARMLSELGMPGLRYLDGISRGAGKGTSNFVVFPGEEGLLKILSRNGAPL
jgi:hypothetical protein